VFRSITLTGRRGAIVWNAGEAATLGAWRASRGNGETTWQLSAVVEKADAYRLKQVPLLFLAPRTNYPRGVSCFPVVPGTLTIGGGSVTATLAQPEGY
jgi:hypothetical protein